MPITANVVAVVAILAGLAGVLLTNWNQRALIRSQYLQDHRTATYLRLLQGVSIRQLQVDEAFSLPPGQQPSITAPADRSSAEETQFYASVLAFASQEAYDLYHAFDLRTIELVGLLNGLRQQHKTAPAQIPNAREIPEIQTADANWRQVQFNLVNLVRAELKFKPSLWHWRLRIRAKKASREPEAQARKPSQAATTT